MKLNSLPAEILHGVFIHVYPPWYLRYTQEHDSQLVGRSNDKVNYGLEGEARYFSLPSIGPLLTCRTFYDIGHGHFYESFTGHVHIASRLLWKELHFRYQGVMSQCRDLMIHVDHAWSFMKLNYITKLPRLERFYLVINPTRHLILDYTSQKDDVDIASPRLFGGKLYDGWSAITENEVIAELPSLAPTAETVRELCASRSINLIYRRLFEGAFYVITEDEEKFLMRPMMVDFYGGPFDPTMISNPRLLELP